MRLAEIVIPDAELIGPVRYVDHAPVYEQVAEWATTELGMDPDAVPAVATIPEWVTTTDAQPVRATARVVNRRIVVVDHGAIVEHRRHESFSDTPACWTDRGDAPVPAGPAAEPESRCLDARCFGGDFCWWGTS